MTLDDANNCEQEENRRLKEVVKELEESLSSRNQKLLEMERVRTRWRGKGPKLRRRKTRLERKRPKFMRKM